MFNWLKNIIKVYIGIINDQIEYNRRSRILYKNADLINREGYVIRADGTLYKKKEKIEDKDITKAQLLSLKTYSDYVELRGDKIYIAKAYPYTRKKIIINYIVIPILIIVSLIIWLKVV